MDICIGCIGLIRFRDVGLVKYKIVVLDKVLFVTTWCHNLTCDCEWYLFGSQNCFAASETSVFQLLPHIFWSFICLIQLLCRFLRTSSLFVLCLCCSVWHSDIISQIDGWLQNKPILFLLAAIQFNLKITLKVWHMY